MDYSGADTGGAGAAVDGGGTTSGGTKNKHSGPLPSLGDSSGVAFLLGNHSKFGLAERCW